MSASKPRLASSIGFGSSVPEALAHIFGISRTYHSSVERSERNVSIDNIARIAKGLEVEPWRLLKDE